MKLKKKFAGKWIVFLLLAFAPIAGCDGGGGEGSVSPNPSGSGVISGTATKGPVSGATITAWAINANGTKGTQIASAQTDGQGNFSIPMGNHSGPVMLLMSEGTYLDEATGSQMSMHPNDVMTCVIPSMPAGSTVNGIQITPLTSMAQSMAQNMSGGMSEANITQANKAMGQYFGVNDILATRPLDPIVNGSGTSATQGTRNYGMTIAAMSQYAKNIGMPHSSGMVTVMMNDASDSAMDGIMTGQGGMGAVMMGSTQIEIGGGMMGGTIMPAYAGTRGLSEAMAQFINSPMNKSGLTVQDMQDLMSKLSASNGQIQ